MKKTKTFCDMCGAEVFRRAIVRLGEMGDPIHFEVVIRNPITNNESDLCLPCVRVVLAAARQLE